MARFLTLTALTIALVFSAAHAQTVRRVLEFRKEGTASITIDDAGSVVYAVSSTNQFGTNPGYLKQIVRWDPATGAGTQITSFEEGVESVSVSDDGTWLAIVSRANPLGSNHDESAEIFVMHPDGTGLAQVTSTSQTPFDQVLSRSEVLGAVISGSGNRIAFLQGSSSYSATATLCVIDRDGTNSRQLVTGVYIGSWTELGPFSSAQEADWRTFDISDDGSKVVYTTYNAGLLRLAGINANGTGNHTFSSTDSATAIAISGNGTKIVYRIGGGAVDTALRARTFDGNPGTIVSLGLGQRPNISDDATQVTFYRQTSGVNPNPSGIWRIASTGGGGTFIAPSALIACATPSGNRFVTRDAELVAVDGAGANPQQLTTTTLNETASDFTMTPDGNTVHFASSITPPGIAPRFFSYDLNTGQFWQRAPVTPLIGAPNLRFSSDGSIFFLSLQNYTGQNACARAQLFRLTANGTYTQLTACGDPSPAGHATEHTFAVRPDGQTVAFLSDDLSRGVFAVGGDGTGRMEITPHFTVWLDLSVAGTGPVSWVTFSTFDDLGGVFRVRSDGTGFQQLLVQPGYGDQSFPTISADGSVVAWMPGDVYDDATQATRRMSTYDVNAPLVTQDGQWVFLNPGRFNVASGVLEYIRGGQPDATGNRWLIVGGMTNGSKTSLSLADLNGVPSFTVGKASPTVLSWDESPFSMRYDAIRGSISNLSIAGSTVSLGPVSCLEDDSPDTHTQGYGDPIDPSPGQAFFYLYRGSVGFDATAGSYGQGTGGRERVAGAGGCNP